MLVSGIQPSERERHTDADTHTHTHTHTHIHTDTDTDTDAHTDTHTHTVLVPESYSTLCNPMDCSPPGSSVMEFSKQECWNEQPFSSQGDPPDPGIKPVSPALQADSLQSELPEKPTYIYTNNFLLHVVCLCCRFFPLIDDHKILNIVPFAIQ